MNTESRPLRVAFASVPKDGGTFTFYRNLRPRLLNHRIEMMCVTVGRREATLVEDAYVDDGCVLLVPEESALRRQARAFVEWSGQTGIDMVFGVNSMPILSALPHLPAQVRVLARCANAFDHGFQVTMACGPRIQRIVALAPGQVEPLVSEYGAERDRIVLIPNATSVKRFEHAARQPRGQSGTLRLGFLGRLEHRQKGVMYLPPLLKALDGLGVAWSLEIAGRGVHEKALRQALAAQTRIEQVRFHGALAPEKIPAFLERIDLFLFPSLFEGSPNALIEAMMAGCVPAAWNLPGITDFLIEDGETGFLEKVGQVESMAERLASLADDRDDLARMSSACAAIARARFSLSRLTRDYVALFEDVVAEPLPSWEPRPWSEFHMEPAFHQPTWKRWLPGPVKKAGRSLIWGRPPGLKDD